MNLNTFDTMHLYELMRQKQADLIQEAATDRLLHDAAPLAQGDTPSTLHWLRSLVGLVMGLLVLLTLAGVQPLQAQSDSENNIYLPLVTSGQAAGTEVNNGDFEAGASGWVAQSNHSRTVIRQTFGTGVTSHSGAYAAWLGFYALEVSTVEQQVTVPAAKPILTYWHWIVSTDQCLRDLASVRINNSEVDSYLLCADTQTTGWVQRTIDLSAYAGQTVTLTFYLKNDGNRNSDLYLDDVGFVAAG